MPRKSSNKDILLVECTPTKGLSEFVILKSVLLKNSDFKMQFLKT
jgi:hypothetical protein